MCRMRAKLSPLLDPLRADSETGPDVIAVQYTMDTLRDTPSHRHARGQVIGALSGLLTIDTPQGRVVVPPSHAIWMPPQQEHGLRSHGPFMGWSVYISPKHCTALPTASGVLRVSALLREAVLRAAHWSTADRVDSAQSHILSVILDEIATLPREQFALPLPTDPRLLKIAIALADHPADQRNLHEWAHWAAIAPRTLTRRFAEETGLSLSAWRQRARLMRALEWLAAGKPVTAIAIDLGYDSLSAFIAMFKKSFGVSPTQYLADVSALHEPSSSGSHR